ncbi:MAG: cytochrome-c peroxidase [Bacteroidia bacterium]
MTYFMQSKLLKIGLFLSVSFVFSCAKTQTDVPVENNTYKPTPYVLQIPAGFPEYNVLSIANPLTVEGIALGKSFYSDPILSTNGRSCTTCHIQSNSFSRPIYNAQNGYAISVPPHVNLAFKKNYNWTGSELNLDTLAMGDFAPEFFNSDSAILYAALTNHPFYKDAFYKAFLIKDIYSLSFIQLQKKIAYSIAQFLRTKVSVNSKYDQLQVGTARYTDEEWEGYNIFFTEKGDCFHCHQPPLFSDNEFHNNGVSATFEGFDAGRWLVSNNKADIGKFATPTLRNLVFTAPYMHDGRFKTLEEVVEFYNSGVNYSPTIDPISSKKAPSYKLNLSTQQKASLVAFLKTLTDDSYVK